MSVSQAPKIVTAADVPGSTSQEPTESAGRRIVRDVEFKGDPRRVIGHPSNPNTEAMQAYAEHLDAGKVAASQTVEVTQVDNSNLINEVPVFDKE
jgi:hypothetical protein